MALRKAELKAIRSAYLEAEGHDLRLTDDAISAIVDKVEGWDDMGEEEQIALFRKAEDAFKGIAISDPSITGIVNRFDDRFEAELTECLDATVKAKTSAVDIYAEFRRLFKADEMDAFPYPGATADDVAGTNYKPDITEKKTVSGAKIRVVFTDDLVNAMPRGKAVQEDIDEANKSLKDSTAPGKFKDKSKKELRAILSSAKQARTAIRGMVSRSIQIHHQWRAIEGMPKVNIDWIRGVGDKCPRIPKEYGKDKDFFLVTQAPKPIWICPVDEDGKVLGAEGNDYSVTQLLAFDVPKAIKAGGTVADLKESAKREPGDDDEGKAMTPADMDSTIVTIWNKLSNKEEMAALRKRLVAPDNDDIREAYISLYLLLRPIYNANKDWYDQRLNGDGTEKETPAKKVEAA